VTCIPLAAATGENLIERSPNFGWYDGPTVLEHLETVELEDRELALPARLPVQAVLREADGARWLAGTLASGVLRRGEAVRVEPAGVVAEVAALSRAGVPVEAVQAGEAVAVRLGSEVDAGRGDVLAQADAPLAATDQCVADGLWVDEV